VQDNQIVKVTSPFDVSVTHGNLCIKGRFGWQYVQERPTEGNGQRSNGIPRRPRDIAAAEADRAGQSSGNGRDGADRGAAPENGPPGNGGPGGSRPADGGEKGNGHR
jgi:hypothetical protein